MSERVEYLVQAYAFGRLTPGEMQELTEAALDNDAVFAAMASADAQRRFLADATTRDAILRRVELVPDQHGWWASLLAGWRKPLPLAATCALLIATVVIYQRDSSAPDQTPTGLDGGAAPGARELFRLPLVENAGISIEPEPWFGATVPEGGPLQLRIHIDKPGAIFVAQLLPDGKARWVIPARLSEDGDRPPGLNTFVFDASLPAPVRQPRAGIVLRVIVTNPGIDPRLPPFTAAPRLVREIRYRVEIRP